MPNLESSSLAGSAPSEQLSGIVARWEHDVADRRFALETGTSGGRTASVPLWEFDLIVAALPGLLATARDVERMANLLADIEARNEKPVDWEPFDQFGDPNDIDDSNHGDQQRHGMWQEQHAVARMIRAARGESAAARSTGSVGNG